MADSIADQFRGLPIEDLIVSPIVGMAKGQAKLNEVTWRYISEVAFEKKGDANVARSLDVEMQRVFTDGDTGIQELKTVYSKVPMLPLVPLPSLAITSASTISCSLSIGFASPNFDSNRDLNFVVSIWSPPVCCSRILFFSSELISFNKCFILLFKL